MENIRTLMYHIDDHLLTATQLKHLSSTSLFLYDYSINYCCFVAVLLLLRAVGGGGGGGGGKGIDDDDDADDDDTDDDDDSAVAIAVDSVIYSLIYPYYNTLCYVQKTNFTISSATLSSHYLL